jgi:hypothetical protein
MASTESVVEGDLVEYLENTDVNLYVCGKAGTGKSVQFKRYAERNRHQILRIAPTGIAALGCGGGTAHRILRLPFDSCMHEDQEVCEDAFKRAAFASAMKAGPELKECSILLVDEIGMFRADNWELIDRILQIVKKCKKPFGGVRVIGFGDLYQIPPIVKREEQDAFVARYKTDRAYFFCTKQMRENPFHVIELTKVFRQKDGRFIDILNSVRIGKVNTEQLTLLNSRFRPDFKAADGFVTLCPRNATVDRINGERLLSLPGKEVSYCADIDERFPKSQYPNDEVVTLKVGCQVMVIKNLYLDDRLIPNGQVGVVSELKDSCATVTFSHGDEDIHFEEWESRKPVVKDGKLESEAEGTFSQIPLRVAFAATIHKVQGVTLDKCVIDMEGGAFTDGQTYVALSRCRSLDGIILKKKLFKSDIRSDETLVNFMMWSQIQGRYVEFVQDEIKGADGDSPVEIDPMCTVIDGGRNGEWVTEEEMSAITDILNSGEESNSLQASRIVLPRMIDELRCLRTEIFDLKAVSEELHA